MAGLCVTTLSTGIAITEANAASTRTQFLEDIQNAYKEALESIESVGLSENTVADWSSDQMSQYAKYISSLGETTGETYAQNFGKQVLNSFKSLDLSPDEIMTAFSAVDWSTVTLDNLDETKDTLNVEETK